MYGWLFGRPERGTTYSRPPTGFLLQMVAPGKASPEILQGHHPVQGDGPKIFRAGEFLIG